MPVSEENRSVESAELIGLYVGSDVGHMCQFSCGNFRNDPRRFSVGQICFPWVRFAIINISQSSRQ